METVGVEPTSKDIAT